MRTNDPRQLVLKPTYRPAEAHTPGDPLQPIVQGRWVWVALKGEWRILTPEEKVRQQYVLRLHEEYGYEFDQMDQERKVRHGFED